MQTCYSHYYNKIVFLKEKMFIIKVCVIKMKHASVKKQICKFIIVITNYVFQFFANLVLLEYFNIVIFKMTKNFAVVIYN